MIKTIKSKGNTNIVVQENGSGPVIILLHGWAMTKELFSAQLTGLAKRFKVVVPDLRGMGDSGKPTQPSDLTLDDYADDLNILVSAYGPEPVTILGWSFGAYVAWAYIRKYGERSVLNCIVVEMTDYLGDPSWATAENEAIAAGYRDYLAAFLEKMFVAPPDERTLSRLLAGSLKTPAAIGQRVNTVMAADDFRSTVKALTRPTLIIYGKHNLFFDDAQKAETAQHIPGSQLVIFDHSRHCPFIEEAERFNEVVSTFVTQK